MTHVPQPIAPGAPLPHRKILRTWLDPFSRRSTPYALFLLVFDLALLAVAMGFVVLVDGLPFKLLAGAAAGLVIARLFIIGHDACHQSLTQHRRLNRWLGRIAFLPSLTPYSLWEVGHNAVHHGYTNLKGFDFVWAPCSVEEFARLSRWQRALDRVYRSGWAPGLYYLVEIWWKRMIYPTRRYMPTRRPVFLLDNLLVSAFAAAWAGGLWAAASATGQSAAVLLLCGLVLPFAVWCTMIGFVVYVHHTHEQVAWHERRAEWAQAQPFVSTTVHLQFGSGIGALLHHIMEHTAHHVDMGIPLYRLKDAQAMLERMLPGRIVIQRFSWRWYIETARRCKLYDFERQAWLPYPRAA